MHQCFNAVGLTPGKNTVPTTDKVPSIYFKGRQPKVHEKQVRRKAI